MNILGLLFGLVSLILLCACSPMTYETCDTDGVIYENLLENHKEWIQFFKVQENKNKTITIRIKNFNYAVRFYALSSEKITIYVSTNSGIPASMLGESGYFYTLEDTLAFTDDRYKIAQLNERIYCYEKVR